MSRPGRASSLEYGVHGHPHQTVKAAGTEQQGAGHGGSVCVLHSPPLSPACSNGVSLVHWRRWGRHGSAVGVFSIDGHMMERAGQSSAPAIHCVWTKWDEEVFGSPFSLGLFLTVFADVFFLFLFLFFFYLFLYFFYFYREVL